MCFAPQWRALFRHRNFQKWSSEPGVLCTFSLRNVLRATTACTFATSQLPKVLRTWGVFTFFTCKCASRHNGVQFFISHLASWLRTHRFSEPTCRPSGATNHWKNAVFRDFPAFSRTWIFFLLRLSLFWSSFFFSSLLFSDSSHLCFWFVHTVGSLTSKLPSITDIGVGLGTLHPRLDTLHSTLHPWHFTLHTLPSTIYTQHSTLYTPHFLLYTLHSTLHTPHSILYTTLHTPHFTLHTLHSTPLYTLHSTLYTLHFTLHTLHSTLYTPHSTLCTLHSALYTLHSTLHTLHSTLCTLHSTLCTLHSTLHTPHFTLYIPHFTLHTLHLILHTPHFSLHTLHSRLYTPHSTLSTPPSIFHSLRCTGMVTGEKCTRLFKLTVSQKCVAWLHIHVLRYLYH